MPVPRRLFKYISLKRDDPATRGKLYERAEKLLLQNELSLSAVDSHKYFNDPYDCATGFSVASFSDAQELQRYAQTHPLVVDKTYTVEEFQESFHREFLSDSEGFATDLVLEARHKAMYFKFSCFSESRDNILMWSHYADSHRGIVVEIDTDAIKNDLFEVSYERCLPTLKDLNDAQESPDIKSLFRLLFARKNTDWSYEKEWRLIVTRTNGLIVPGTDTIQLPNGCVKAVYVGWLHDKDSLSLSSEALRKSSIPIFRMEKSREEYKLLTKEF